MNKNRLYLIILAVLLLSGVVYWQMSSRKSDTLTLPSTSRISPTLIPTQKEVSVEEVGITLSIPTSYYFGKEEQMNLTTKKPYAVNFTIQNYESNPNTVPNPYQLYGNYQWDTDKISLADFKEADFYLNPETRQEFSVADHPAIKGVAKGERGRYTIYIYIDGYMLVLAADGNDDEHKKITDEIVKNIKFAQ